MTDGYNPCETCPKNGTCDHDKYSCTNDAYFC